MASRKRSAVWMYFEASAEKSCRSLCQLCSENIQHSGNTSNMLKHLKYKHPQEFSHVVEMRKVEPPSSCKKKRISTNKKYSETESESKQALVTNANDQKEVRVQYSNQEMNIMMPYLKINKPHSTQQSIVVSNNIQQPSVKNANAMHEELELEVQASLDKNCLFDQSHASELHGISGNLNGTITNTNFGENVFATRKRTEWMDLFHDSLRPHLRDMNRQQQREYFSRVSQAVLEILNSSR